MSRFLWFTVYNTILMDQRTVYACIQHEFWGNWFFWINQGQFACSQSFVTAKWEFSWLNLYKLVIFRYITTKVGDKVYIF